MFVVEPFQCIVYENFPQDYDSSCMYMHSDLCGDGINCLNKANVLIDKHLNQSWEWSYNESVPISCCFDGISPVSQLQVVYDGDKPPIIVQDQISSTSCFTRHNHSSSYADAAIALQQDWIEAIRNELGFDFNIDIDD